MKTTPDGIRNIGRACICIDRKHLNLRRKALIQAAKPFKTNFQGLAETQKRGTCVEEINVKNLLLVRKRSLRGSSHNRGMPILRRISDNALKRDSGALGKTTPANGRDSHTDGRRTGINRRDRRSQLGRSQSYDGNIWPRLQPHAGRHRLRLHD